MLRIETCVIPQLALKGTDVGFYVYKFVKLNA